MPRVDHEPHLGGIAGYRPDLGQLFRSRWEANYARILRHEGTEFSYEPNRFTVTMPNGDRATYIPDFLIGDRYIEVKGLWRNDSREKVDAFRVQFPDLTLEVIDATAYANLEARYAASIAAWEWRSSEPPATAPRFCAHCGAVLVNKVATARYCHSTCASKAMRLPTETRVCARCSQPFPVMSGSKNKRVRARRYCSHTCAVHDNMLIALESRWADHRVKTRA